MRWSGLRRMSNHQVKWHLVPTVIERPLILLIQKGALEIEIMRPLAPRDWVSSLWQGHGLKMTMQRNGMLPMLDRIFSRRERHETSYDIGNCAYYTWGRGSSLPGYHIY